MTEPKYVNCWTTSTVFFLSRATGGLVILEDGSMTIVLNLSQLTCSPTFTVFSCRMWSASTSWSMDSAMSVRSSEKVSVRENKIAKFKSKSKPWGCPWYDTVYDDVEQFRCNDTTLPNRCINSEERSSSAVYLDAAFCFIMEVFQECGIYLAGRWTSRWSTGRPGQLNRRQLGSLQRRWMFSVETLWFSRLLDGLWTFALCSITLT